MRRRCYNNRDKNTMLLLHYDGNYDDACGNECNLIYNNNYISYVIGKFSNAIRSSVTSDVSYYYYNKQIDLNSTDVTIEFFAKIGNSGGNASIRVGSKISSYLGQDGQFCVNINYNNNITILVANSGYTSWSIVRQTSITIPSDGLFHHVAITYNSGSCKIYIDGVYKYTTTLTLPTTQNGNVAVLLDNNHVLDELRISNVIRYTANFNIPTKPYEL